LTQALLDRQADAVKKLEKLKVGALFMRPGTGKTRTAIELINSSKADFVLWLTPFQTKTNLHEELNKWGLEKLVRVEGVESLSNSDRLFLELIDELKSKKHAFIVMDESLKIKNEHAKRTERVLELSKFSEYRLVLNGTPLSKNLLDLWSQMEFLSPKILQMGKQQFKQTFAVYVRYRKRDINGNFGRWIEIIKRYTNLKYLYSLIDPYVFDADLELDKRKQYVRIDYQINKRLDDYMIIRDKFLQALEFGDQEGYIKATQALQHSYCDEPEKIEVIRKIVDSKTIIFTKFIKSQDAVQKSFPEAKVLTYGKGSYGLNLQEYNKIIFFDKTFDYAQRDQAEHRIYRVGQTDDVTYYDLTGNVNLEKTIDKNIDKKADLLVEFKKLIAKGDEIDWRNVI